MRRLASFLLATATAMSLVPASPAVAARGDLIFFGAGYGHGIGMSQWGAYGLVTRGWTPARVMKLYYGGTKVQELNPPASRFRIGLVQYRSNVNVTATAGRMELSLTNGKVLETVGKGGSRRIRITKDQRYRIIRPNGSVVGNRSWGGTNVHLRVKRRSGGVIKLEEWGRHIGRGHVELDIVGPEAAHVVAVLSAEAYMHGIHEVWAGWPARALQVQAIASRSYAYNKVMRNPEQRQGECSCGLFATTRDQYYVGYDRETMDLGSRWVDAVRATRRKVVTHKGSPILAMYSSSSGGFTENNENVWGGAPEPYLRGRCDPGDYVQDNSHRTWKVTLSQTDAATKLRSSFGWDIARVTGFDIGRRGVSGRVLDATVSGRNGGGARVSFTASGWSLRNALGLQDMRFWVNQNRLVTGQIRAAYDGLMCRPGLARSAQRSVKGGSFQVFEVGRIYRHDGKRKEVWLRGPIVGKYVKIGGHASVLRLPYRFVQISGKAARARFDRGEIYWTRAYGAREVHGPVVRAYRKAGYHTGKLGYPTSDVRKLANGSLRSTFQSGTITCPPGAACTIDYA